MASNGNGTYVYVGLSGEGREGSGLFRSTADLSQWEDITTGLPANPQVRTVVVHPRDPAVVYTGTQDGPYISADRGGRWSRLDFPERGLPIWSVVFHPKDSQIMFAGGEDQKLYRSENGGHTWRRLPINVVYPDVTMHPRVLPKRILGLAIDPAYSDEMYAAVEVGGLIRSMDGGDHWEGISEGQYLNDDPVDMHGVAVSSAKPRAVFAIARAGMFHSPDRGAHWQHVGLENLSPRGTYCRAIRVAPDDPHTLYVAAGPAFRSETGVLYRSRDLGKTWERLDFGAQAQSTIFGLSINPRDTDQIYCSTRDGQVFGTADSGHSWKESHLPEGAKEVNALACG